MDMKNWFLTFGILGMVMTTFAQDTVSSGKGTTINGSAKSEMRAGEFYGRLVATKQTNTEIVRFTVDEIVYRMTRDVDLRSTLKAIVTIVTPFWKLKNKKTFLAKKVYRGFYPSPEGSVAFMPHYCDILTTILTISR